MSFDPSREDYQRLALRFVSQLDGTDPLRAAREFATFGRRFAQDRDSLPQTDEDRAFHLVSLAATIIDYDLPFSRGGTSQELLKRARSLLNEAISLDPRCYDAIRMLRAADIPSFDLYYKFLEEAADEVGAHCREQRDLMLATHEGDRAVLASKIAMHPYLRWLGMQASKAVICGRNRQAIGICDRLLELDPEDTADARFTAAIAYAKLEDEDGLDALAHRTRRLSIERARGPEDAWMQIARMALLFKQYRMAEARRQLETLCNTYPYAAATIFLQHELPDGVFYRLAVPPYSEDELIVACSEATVLFQEGRARFGHGSLGTWLAERAKELAPKEDIDALVAREDSELNGDSGEGR